MGDKKIKQKTRLSEEMRKQAKGALYRGRNVMEDYRDTANNPLPSMYTGISDERGQALQMMQQGGQAYAPAFDAWQQNVRGDDLNVTENPYFNRIVDRSVGQAMAPMASQFAAYGAGPSSLQSTIADLGANTGARLYGQWHEGARNRQMGAIQQTPMMDQMQFSDAQRLGNVGQQYEQDQQNQQREDLRQYTHPMMLAQQENALLASNPLVGESNSTQITPFDWLGFVGGIVGGLMPSPQSLMGGGGGGP